MSNSPVRIKEASNMSQGENYYMYDRNMWVRKGQRGRMGSLFRSLSDNYTCSARSLDARGNVLYKNEKSGGSFQALIEPQA